jgi:excisionase family DNA binding protein
MSSNDPAGTNVEPAINSPYLTTAEAAAYLRTTPQGIYSLVKRGRLRPMPGSRKLLFTREGLDACLRGRACRR